MAFKDARKFDAFALVEVLRTERISPNFVRITVGGEQLVEWPAHGYDQWFRLFLPQEEGRTSFDIPHQMTFLSYLKFLRIPSAERPHMRNYTVREFRVAERELDIDFVVHGDHGVATSWCQSTRPGDQVALIDQGCGYDPTDDLSAHQLLVTDETGLPAVAGVLRDLPREATGDAFIELSDAADQRELAGPPGVAVHWLIREPGARPGSLAIEAVQAWTPPSSNVWAYLVGERAIPTTLRRWLVNDHQVSKNAVHFVGYWRIA